MVLDGKLFCGSQIVIIDSKYRFNCPSSFYSSELKGLDVAIVPNYNTVVEDFPCLSITVFDDIEKKLISKGGNSAAYFSLLNKTKCDNQGRIRIPSNLLRHINIEKGDDVYLLGEKEFMSIYNLTDGGKVLEYLSRNQEFCRWTDLMDMD